MDIHGGRTGYGRELLIGSIIAVAALKEAARHTGAHRVAKHVSSHRGAEVVEAPDQPERARRRGGDPVSA